MKKEFRITREKSPNGKGHVYYVQALDTDSHLPVYIKIWDSSDIPVSTLAKCLSWELSENDEEHRNLKFDFNMK